MIGMSKYILVKNYIYDHNIYTNYKFVILIINME